MPKVLLVEDDNNLREIFEMRLQAEGYDTVTAGNGEEGLTVAMKERPDLIISDVMMPKLSGFEMLETLRSAPEGKDVKVIMMTALGQADDQSRGEKLGVIKYLVKSQATLDDFARVVREVLPPAGGADATAAATTPTESSLVNQQEGNTTMPEDPSTQNPAAPATPPADNPAPDAAPTTPADTPAPAAPAADAGVSTDQQSTTQEASAVQDQINDFVANAPAADSAAPSADSMTPPAPAMPSEPAPAADASTSFAPATAPTDTGVTNPVAAPGAPDMSMPAADPTSADAPAVPPATPPADTPPATPPQTDAPAVPPADSSNAI
ncbi:MAG TPA: response regulator [Candidatus Saccharimonadales bacterium]|nr:response regulator [Candidatus Saccharimonadales bacterium]